MQDIFKNIFLAGLGAAVITKEKVVSLAETLVQQGKMNKEDVEKFADNLVEESRQHAQALAERLEKAGAEAMARLEGDHKQEIEELSRRVAALEEKVESLSQAAKG